MKKAALHPVYMASRQLRPLITLFQVYRWPVLKNRLQDSKISCYSLFGRFDILVNTYASPTMDMEMFLSRQGIDESLYSDLTVSFRADRVDRMHGQTISWPSEVLNKSVSSEDVQAVSKLQQSWDAIDRNYRNSLIEREIILPEPMDDDSNEDNIHAFILIRLPVVSASEFEVQRKFLNGTIFRDFRNEIPTVMWSGAQMGHHLFIECKVKMIRELVRIVMHELHELDPRGLQSETYIALEKLNHVDPTIEEELDKLPQDIGDTTLQKFHEISQTIDELVRKYYPDEAEKLRQVNDKERLSAVYIFNQMAGLIDSILDKSDDSELTRVCMDIRNDIIMTSLFSDIHYIKKVGQQMGSLLEVKIRRVVANRVSSKFTSRQEIQKILKLPSAKGKYLFEEMTAGHIYNAINELKKAFPHEPLFPDEFVTQWHQWTKLLRDGAVHGRELQAEDAVNRAIDGLRIIEALVKLRASDPDKVKFDSPMEGERR